MKKYNFILLVMAVNISLYAADNGININPVTQSINIGPKSKALGYNAVSMGSQANAVGNNSISIGSSSQTVGNNSVSMGYNAVTLNNSSVAIGTTSKAINSGSIAVGYGSLASKNGSLAIGIESQAKGEASVALGDGSVATENNSVSVGSDDLKRKIVNMKDGVANSDGVTVGQLNKKADKSEVAKNSIKIIYDEKNIQANTENIKNIANYENVSKENTENIAKNTNQIHTLNNRVDHLDSKLNRGMSLMAAMSSIDFGSSKSGDLLLGAGVGHYVNSDAVALGLSYSPSQDLRVNGKYSVSTDDPSSSAAGVGMTYRLANFN